MKTTLRLPATLAVLLLLLPACQDLFRQHQAGTLVITLDAPAGTATRAGTGLPDTGSFLLTVSDAAGKIYYEGPFAQSPDELDVPAGTYTVSAESGPFDTPAFEAPQWGDTQVVSVAAGASVSVALSCRQLNCGLRLDIDATFRQAFPNGALSLRDASGSLPYGYEEVRAAYFRPGTVSLLLDDSGYVQTLFARTLEARQMLTVRLSANVETKSGGISLSVDTTRNWLSDSYVYGGRNAGEAGSAYDVATARTHAGEQDVWVCGYIVGVATGTAKASFTPPFTKDTNLILGTRAATSDLDYCLTVELKSGPIREALNLKDHPGLLGRKLSIKGDLVSAYYGIPGLKAPTEYQLP